MDPSAVVSPHEPDGRSLPSPARVRVRIAGDEYILRGATTPQRLQRLAEELDRRLAAVVKRHPRLLLHQAAVLCALQILEELEQAREENRDLLELLGDRR